MLDASRSVGRSTSLASPVKTQKPRGSVLTLRSIPLRSLGASFQNASYNRSNESHSSFDELSAARSAHRTASASTTCVTRTTSTEVRDSVTPAENPLALKKRQKRIMSDCVTVPISTVSCRSLPPGSSPNRPPIWQCTVASPQRPPRPAAFYPARVANPHNREYPPRQGASKDSGFGPVERNRPHA